MNLNEFEWEEQLFNDCFNSEVEYFSNRIKNDPEFTMDELQKYLDTAYSLQNENWMAGRVMSVKNNARAAAIETVIFEWKKSLIEQ